MKIIKVYNIYILIAFVALMFCCCKKNDNSDSSPIVINPTNGKTTAVFNLNLTYGSMTDQDGNVYKTITIGTQTWMAENLRTTKYRDGSAIPKITSSSAWSILSTGAYCNYNNTVNNDTIATYGRLYNWYAVSDIRNIAPLGWHVPSDVEWSILTTYLGGVTIAGGKMKETGLNHWLNSNVGASNASGFTDLPNGFCIAINTISFIHIGFSSGHWSSTSTFSFGIENNYSGCHSGYSDNRDGNAVRCVKD